MKTAAEITRAEVPNVALEDDARARSGSMKRFAKRLDRAFATKVTRTDAPAALVADE